MNKDFRTDGFKTGKSITGPEAIDIAFPSFSKEEKQELLERLAKDDRRVRLTNVEATTITFAPSERQHDDSKR